MQDQAELVTKKYLDKKLDVKLESFEKKLDKKLDRKFGEFASFVQKGFDSVTTSILQLDKRVAALEKRVARLDKQFGQTHGEIKEIKDRLSRIETQLHKQVYRHEFERLEERVTQLEKEAAKTQN